MRSQTCLRIGAIFIVSASLSFVASAVRGDAAIEPLSAAKLTELAKPFVDADTGFIMHADLARVDVNALRDRITAGIAAAKLSPQDTKDANDGIAKTADESGKWVADFRKAGGRNVFVELTLSGKREGQLIVAPLEPGADARAIQGLLFSGKSDGPTGNADQFKKNPQMARFARQAEVVGNAVVLGTRTDIDAISNGQPADRPDLATAFDAAGNAPVGYVIIPTDNFRAMMEKQIGQNLPPALGGGPVTILTRGIQWISVCGEMPPKSAVSAIVQCTDAAAAKSAEDALLAGQQFLAGLPPLPDQPAWGMLTKGLTPTVKDSRITLSLDTAAVDRMMPSLAMSIAQARRSALQMQSMSNMRQMLMGCIMYSNANKGEWPADLDAVVTKYLNGNKELLKNPQRPDLEKPYVYLKPSQEALRDSSKIIVIHESADDKAKTVNAGFADGHVERLPRAEFEKRLTETETANEGGL